MSTWTLSRFRYERIARSVSPAIRLTTKDAWPWRVIAWALFLVTLGRLKRARFLEDFATTIGPIQAYPRAWPTLRDRTVVHEGAHTLQFLAAAWFVPVLGWLRWWPTWTAFVGVLPMAVAYLLFPVPLLLAWGRYRLELAADARSWAWALEAGALDPAGVRQRARAFAETVSSWAYGRAWPRAWALRGFARRAEAVIAAFEAQRPAKPEN